jgi:hypothetical protein
MKYEYEKYIYKAEMETRRYETKIETFRWHWENKQYLICFFLYVWQRPLQKKEN